MLETKLRAPLPAGPWLIVAPRLQDVVAGMGGAFMLARRRGMRVNVVLLDASEAEIEAAGQLLRDGIATAPADTCKVHALDVLSAQAGAPAASPDSVRRLTEAVASIEFRSVFFPSPWSGDDASRTVFALVRECLHDTGSEIAGYGFETTRQIPINALVDISDSVDDKRRLLELLQARALFEGHIEVPLALSRTRTLDLPARISAAEGFLAMDRTLDPTLAGRLQQLPALSTPPPDGG
ncbi:MAG: hypothetical protein K9L70_13935, partial [Thiohalocapsa sp.]|nr:hypothetical protein [Thiohalocapsa sp.]